MMRVYSKGVSGQPCLRPQLRSIGSERKLLSTMVDVALVYITSSQCLNDGPKFICSMILYRKGRFTLSKAFSWSRLIKIRLFVLMVAE